MARNSSADVPLEVGPRYIVMHSLVGDKLAGQVYVPNEGEDVSRLLELGAIAQENVAVDAPMPEMVEGEAGLSQSIS